MNKTWINFSGNVEIKQIVGKVKNKLKNSINRLKIFFFNTMKNQNYIALIYKLFVEMVLDAALLNTQHKVKCSNPGNAVAPFPTPCCSSYWKRTFRSPSTKVANSFLIYKLILPNIFSLNFFFFFFLQKQSCVNTPVSWSPLSQLP